MQLDAESLYRQIGHLLETIPEFPQGNHLDANQHLWLGRAGALVSEAGDVIDNNSWLSAVRNLQSAIFYSTGLEEIKLVLYRMLGRAELKAPPSARGAFIPVGSTFDAFAAFSKLLQTATSDILIVDPYLDEIVLTEFGQIVPEKVRLRLLSDEKQHKPTLSPAARRWVGQFSETRPLSVRLAFAGKLHDRLIIIDQKERLVANPIYQRFCEALSGRNFASK